MEGQSYCSNSIQPVITAALQCFENTDPVCIQYELILLAVKQVFLLNFFSSILKNLIHHCLSDPETNWFILPDGFFFIIRVSDLSDGH